MSGIKLVEVPVDGFEKPFLGLEVEGVENLLIAPAGIPEFRRRLIALMDDLSDGPDS